MIFDPNVGTVEIAARLLGPIMDELVLVGGCAVGLHITDRGRWPARLTVDVDLLTEVTPLSNYYELCERLRQRGFKENDDVICRWQLQQLKIDLMPTDEKVLGFTNSWHAEAVRTSQQYTLPSGRVIRIVAPRVLIAVKFESFNSRGNADYLHHDLEDIITLIDGRPELVAELNSNKDEVQSYVSDELEALITRSEFDDRLVWLLGGHQDRKRIVLERIRILCGL